MSIVAERTQKTEKQSGEKWVAHVSRGLEILHPLSRQAVLQYLDQQARFLRQEIELDGRMTAILNALTE